jgi:hypothetical protein
VEETVIAETLMPLKHKVFAQIIQEKRIPSKLMKKKKNISWKYF